MGVLAHRNKALIHYERLAAGAAGRLVEFARLYVEATESTLSAHRDELSSADARAVDVAVEEHLAALRATADGWRRNMEAAQREYRAAREMVKSISQNIERLK